MAKVEVGTGRSQIENTPLGLRITIPSKKNYFLILFLAFWLVGWALGESKALSEVLNPGSEGPELFTIAWLGAWTVGGVFAIYAWLWNMLGKEIINLSRTELQHIRHLPIFQKSKEYELASISNLRTQVTDSSLLASRNNMEFWGMSGGSIVFDYGRSTYQFGVQLDEAEASHLVSTIKQRYQHL